MNRNVALLITFMVFVLFALIVYNGTKVESLERKVEALESVIK